MSFSSSSRQTISAQPQQLHLYINVDKLDLFEECLAIESHVITLYHQLHPWTLISVTDIWKRHVPFYISTYQLENCKQLRMNKSNERERISRVHFHYKTT